MKDNRPVSIDPSSVLYRYGQSAPWVVYHDVQLTTKEYMREVVKINPTWLTELAPHFYMASDRRKQGQQSKKRKARAAMLPPRETGILGMLAAEDDGIGMVTTRVSRKGKGTKGTGGQVKRRRPVF